MIARPRSIPIRERREIAQRLAYSIHLDPQSDGEWKASVVKDTPDGDVSVYRSGAMPSPEEALSLAAYELDGVVEKIVDALEKQDEEAGL